MNINNSNNNNHMIPWQKYISIEKCNYFTNALFLLHVRTNEYPGLVSVSGRMRFQLMVFCLEDVEPLMRNDL